MKRHSALLLAVLTTPLFALTPTQTPAQTPVQTPAQSPSALPAAPRTVGLHPVAPVRDARPGCA